MQISSLGSLPNIFSQIRLSCGITRGSSWSVIDGLLWTEPWNQPTAANSPHSLHDARFCMGSGHSSRCSRTNKATSLPRYSSLSSLWTIISQTFTTCAKHIPQEWKILHFSLLLHCSFLQELEKRNVNQSTQGALHCKSMWSISTHWLHYTVFLSENNQVPLDCNLDPTDEEKTCRRPTKTNYIQIRLESANEVQCHPDKRAKAYKTTMLQCQQDWYRTNPICIWLAFYKKLHNPTY